MSEPKSKYHRRCKGVEIDVYEVLTAFGVTDHAIAHAIKKLLAPGQRGAKSWAQDVEEAIKSCRRALEMYAEAQQPVENQQAVAEAVAWIEDESHWIDPEDGKRYEAVENDTCHGCVMDAADGRCAKTLDRGRPACNKTHRKDGNDISWQEVTK